MKNKQAAQLTMLILGLINLVLLINMFFDYHSAKVGAFCFIFLTIIIINHNK